MKRLVIGNSVFVNLHFRIAYDEAEEAYKNGEEVVFATCAGRCHSCWVNPCGGRVQCAICSFACRILERRFKNRIRVVKFPHVDRARLPRFEYSTVEELKNVTYRGVNVGYAVMSEYVSWTRDADNEIDVTKHSYFDFLLQEACCYVEVAAKLIEQEKPDAISAFNCRFLEARPFLEYSRGKGIPVRIIEADYRQIDESHGEFLRSNFNNMLPHDIAERAVRIRRCWDESKLTESDRLAVAESFFNKRRRGVFAGDASRPGFEGVFIGHQAVGSLPRGFDLKKKNIVIFNSSQDEFFSIDKAFEERALFRLQIDGVRAVATALKDNPNCHIYLRVHPNLSRVKYRYHLDLYELDKEFDNITIIPAASECSTYDLMAAADKVVVFGSTMGVEATVARKPVILIGTALYYDLDIAYKPKSVAEMVELLKQDNLPPRPIDDALKYGYYVVRKTDICFPPAAIDLGMHRAPWFGRDVFWPDWPNFLGAHLFFRIVQARRFRCMRFLARHPMPMQLFVSLG